MLRYLGVRNLAVIERLEVEFEPGFNVLTGETGAGKSILVEALGLLVGGRASGDLVRTGEATAVVQAVFETPDRREVIVRREVSAQGRSRAFIDDALATSSALRELGGLVLELHGQHEHQRLIEPAEQVELLDAAAGLTAEAAAVATHFADWRHATDALDRARLTGADKRERIEALSFQCDEIDRVDPQPGEYDRLAAERAVLANADRLGRLAKEAYGALYEGEHAALSSLGLVWKRLADLATLDSRFAAFLGSREVWKPALEDLAFTLRRYAADLDASPERLQAVEDRLAALERLMRRHGPSLEDVLATRTRLAAELDALIGDETRLEALVERERAARERFLEGADRLSDARQSAAPRLAGALERDLHVLAMPGSRVTIHVRPDRNPPTWTARGIDRVEVLFSPTPGEEPRPLGRVASGGELSRFMLALRLLTQGTATGRTLVFDEVDAGIGGEAADAVGARLQTLGRRQQVLCVTHLAQIAARAPTHFRIEKTVRAARTRTSVERLDRVGREEELGRMIAGAAVSANVLASARELLEAGESEYLSKDVRDSATLIAKAKVRLRGH